MTTLVCPVCGTRWKILPGDRADPALPPGDVPVLCPNHAPRPGVQLAPPND